MKQSYNYLYNVLSLAVFVLLDVLFITSVLYIAIFIREDIFPKVFNSIPEFQLNTTFMIITVIFWISFLWYEGLYTKKLFFWDEVKILWKSSIFVPAAILFLASLTKSNEHISRAVLVVASLWSILTFPAYKILVKIILRKLNINRRSIVIVGSKKVVFEVYRAIKADINTNCELKFFLVTDLSKKRRINKINLLPLDFSYINSLDVDEVYLCMKGIRISSFQKIVENIQMKTSNIFIIPDIKNFPLISSEFHLVFHKQLFLLELKNNLLNFYYRVAKDMLDRILALLLIVILFIPMIIIAVLIRLDSDGPVIFTQQRVGKDGKLFKIYKFRTMYLNADEILNRYLMENPDAKRELEKYWKLKNDPRVTKIGKFLRKTSLDELPQLFNVLKGDMSLVGPRPYLPREIELLGENKKIVLSVKPGITGLWQVSGRNMKDYEDRIALDIWYIRNWSLWVDLIILIKTFLVVLKKEGAY